MFRFPGINQTHNILTTNKMHFNIYEVFCSQSSHQHVSAAIAAIFRVMLLLQSVKKYKCG